MGSLRKITAELYALLLFVIKLFVINNKLVFIKIRKNGQISILSRVSILV